MEVHGWIPAYAGMTRRGWIPAYTGMTRRGWRLPPGNSRESVAMRLRATLDQIDILRSHRRDAM
jgi:hypothetical protein